MKEFFNKYKRALQHFWTYRDRGHIPPYNKHRDDNINTGPFNFAGVAGFEIVTFKDMLKDLVKCYNESDIVSRNTRIHYNTHKNYNISDEEVYRDLCCQIVRDQITFDQLKKVFDLQKLDPSSLEMEELIRKSKTPNLLEEKLHSLSVIGAIELTATLKIY